MTDPISTYRFQFHKDFTFQHFKPLIPYLKALGIKTVYASPIFEATPGSVHGYDGVNPHKVNPEIGTGEELLEISRELRQQGMHWIQDIVPNHMAFDPNNPWLQDVLEKGQLSEYASFFDIPWTGRIYRGKVMLPFLGKPLAQVIDDRELQVVFNDNKFVLKYYESTWPLRLKSYIYILKALADTPSQSVTNVLEQVLLVEQSEDISQYKEQVREVQLQIAGLLKNEDTGHYLQQCIDRVNNDPELLTEVATHQVYQLCDWQKTDSQINFRRFFTVNGLICLNMQDKEVFEHYHRYIKELIDKGVFQGLRIDHVDGLFDPTDYLDKLRALVGQDVYVVVEKILEQGEKLPDWPIQGNTGYDFLAYVNNLFTNSRSGPAFDVLYKTIVDDSTPIGEQVFGKKALILCDHMGGELNNLVNLFFDLNLSEDGDGLDEDMMKQAISELLIRCPVYRFYGNALPLHADEEQRLDALFESITTAKPELSNGVEVLRQVLLVKPKENDTVYNSNVMRFYQRCMQFSGPLMAKGVEDTLMYTYNRFIGHNEVGDSPEAFGYSAHEFHALMEERQHNWSLSMNGTSTHDTKRGEDVRARLNVLTDMPQRWTAAVNEWREHNRSLIGEQRPTANDEYLVYQTLIGGYPMPGEPDDSFLERLEGYLEKALREAKTNSNWTAPNQAYEDATKHFAKSLFDADQPFWKSFAALHQEVCDFGIVNSLSQVALKVFCPGVPDFYQGSELWDLSLVDPDNRRPIDYEQRQRILQEAVQIDSRPFEQAIHSLWTMRYSGEVKLWLIRRLLRTRNEQPEFYKGAYQRVEVSGTYAHNVFAFLRSFEQGSILVVVPLYLASICEKADAILTFDWKDTAVSLDAGRFSSAINILAEETEPVNKATFLVKDIFKQFPLAVLKLQ